MAGQPSEFMSALSLAAADAFGGRDDMQASDLIPPIARQGFYRALSAWKPGRGSRAQEKWLTIVGAATAKPRSLGFVVVTDGTTGLGEVLGTNSGNASYTVARWVEHGVVVRFQQARDRGLPILIGLQLPDLTDAYTWLAGRTYYSLAGLGHGGAPMPPRMARDIAVQLLERRSPMPEDAFSFLDGKRVLDAIASGFYDPR